MLTQLTLQNLALVTHAEIEMNAGFNIITGETGAGKSLLLDALTLCVGGRSDAGLIRHGQTTADAFAEFNIGQLPEVMAWLGGQNYPFEDDTLLIRRQLANQNGTLRSKAWLNGMPISMNELKTLGGLLVNIHSQHAQQSLLRPQFVMEWLDSATGLNSQASDVKQAFLQYERLKSQAAQHAKDEQLRQQQIQLLSNQLADIEPIATVLYSELEAEYDELSNLENLMQQAALSVQLLDNDSDEPDVISLLNRAIKLCEAQTELSQTYADCVEQLYLAHTQIAEVVSTLSNYAEGQSLDPKRLALLDEQLSTFHRLARKYHTTPESLVEDSQAWQQQLDDLQSVMSPEAMAEQIEQAYQAYLQKAQALDDSRRANATMLAEALVARLKALALPNVQAAFEFTPLDKPQSIGLSQIDLLFSANVGMPMQPIHKIASGGELSRLALIMQVIDAQGVCRNTTTDMATTTRQLLVFDEVDVGISGGTAQVVGELLRELGEEQQIIAITHQSQVAAQAHQHILVYKTQQEKAQSHLKILSGDEQVQELARMSGGVNITEDTLKHARSLLASRRVS
ncbi:DNA repair protein RecN [Moraxella osloensis]|uniref:DNA repair protein RecN n=1 Tax=Faucicola osloensis TaxID=34062 RepID=A0A2I5HRQ1_FAUOS|nr:DNA repair protein RecN [Moraxella osloensis]ATW71178.1 DNA repair protein RecN [Moraxella osloensis]